MIENLTEKTMKIGPYELKSVPTGEFGLDGGAMFGTVPKVLWEKTNPTNEQNQIKMEARALLLKSKDRIVLIDTGNGGDFIEKYGEKLGTNFNKMYGVHDNRLIDSLKKYGVKPEDVTDVVLTHLHFDHAGGATCVRDGKIVPTFQNAKYYVQKENLKTAQEPNIRERASYLPSNFQPLLDAGVLTLLNGPTENVVPFVSTVLSFGHTKAHQMVKISDGKTTVVYCGDVIPTSTHVRLAWIMGYDLEPLTIIEEKRALLTEAAQNKWYLYFEHDPYCDMATVSPNKDDFKVEQRYQLR